MKTRIKTATLALLLSLAAGGQALADRPTLPRHSLLCGSERQMEEAVKAVDRGDVRWLESLTSCFVTNRDVPAQRLDCGLRTCKIRFWGPDGSAIGYTFRNYLKG